VQRVSVVGTSGAGKSTVAAALAALLGASFLELDSVHHQADWTPLPRADPVHDHLRFVRLRSAPSPT
jgi:gluconate kinase